MNRRHPDSQLELRSCRTAGVSPRRAEPRPASGLVAIVSGLVLALLPVAGGSTSFGASLPIALRTSTSLAPADTGAIKAFVDDGAAKLAGTDIPVANKAREALAAEVLSGANASQQPSAAFLYAYAQAINSGLGAAAKNPDLRVRVNAAIVVARVAQKAENGGLAPITVTLLGDSSDAVVSWGAKAAAFELFWVLSPPGAPKNEPLLAALSAAGKKPKAEGMVVQNVYGALNVTAPPNTPDAVWTKVIGLVVPEVQAIIRNRLEQYKEAMPSDPAVEKYGLAILSRKEVWNKQNPAAQATTNQLLVDTIAFAGQRLTTAPQAAHRGLAVVINEAGKNMWVVGDHTANQKLKTAVAPVMSASDRVPVAQVISAAAGHFSAVQGALPGVKAPATLAPLPSTQPAAAPQPENVPTTTRAS